MTTDFPFRAFLFAVAFICGVTSAEAQLRLLGHGTQTTHFGDRKFTIEITIDEAVTEKKLTDLGVEYAGTIRIRTDAKELLYQQLYITRPGDTKARSLIAFYVDKGYPSTVRVETWQEEKTFRITDTFQPDWTTVGVITEIKKEK